MLGLGFELVLFFRLRLGLLFDCCQLFGKFAFFLFLLFLRFVPGRHRHRLALRLRLLHTIDSPTFLIVLELIIGIGVRLLDPVICGTILLGARRHELLFNAALAAGYPGRLFAPFVVEEIVDLLLCCHLFF